MSYYAQVVLLAIQFLSEKSFSFVSTVSYEYYFSTDFETVFQRVTTLMKRFRKKIVLVPALRVEGKFISSF